MLLRQPALGRDKKWTTGNKWLQFNRSSSVLSEILDMRTLKQINNNCDGILFARNMQSSNRVVSADTINTFKNRLDKFWSDQEVLYDYNTDLHGIENRSLL